MSAQVPYITKWSTEDICRTKVVMCQNGIGYADEILGDRDSRGILWTRNPSHPGEGKPHFGEVHGPRQRRAMRKLLCQVCANPADRSDDGVLWIMRDHRDDWPGWPEGIDVTEPPICATCAELSARICPALRQGHALIRARIYPVVGVLGSYYDLTPPSPSPVEAGVIAFADPRIRWTVATQLARQLTDCTIVDAP